MTTDRWTLYVLAYAERFGRVPRRTPEFIRDEDDAAAELWAMGGAA